MSDETTLQQLKARVEELEKQLKEEVECKDIAYADRSRLAQTLAYVLKTLDFTVGFRGDTDGEWPLLVMRLTKDPAMLITLDDGTVVAKDEIAFHLRASDLILAKEKLKEWRYPYEWEYAHLVQGKSPEEMDEFYKSDSENRAKRMRDAVFSEEQEKRAH